MMNEEKLLTMIAEMDLRIKSLEAFKAKYEAETVTDGVCLDGAPEYIQEYVKNEKERAK